MKKRMILPNFTKKNINQTLNILHQLNSGDIIYITTPQNKQISMCFCTEHLLNEEKCCLTTTDSKTTLYNNIQQTDPYINYHDYIHHLREGIKDGYGTALFTINELANLLISGNYHIG